MNGVVRAALLLAGAATIAAAPDDGWLAYSEGHTTEAVAIWVRAAAAGSGEAAFGLGVAYDLGQGVLQDEASACRWYRRAGEAGIMPAAFNTAVMLDQGRCGTRDAAAVAAWYGRAAAFGHARAAYDLAQLYETGDGVPLNPSQAAAWYKVAAAQGLSAATDKAATLARSPRAPVPALRPVLLAVPRDEAVPDRGSPVPFVWSVPVQPGTVRFFLEVDALADGGVREVAAQYADQSAALVTLPPGAAQYAWRVYTVSPTEHRYVASAWSRFQVVGRTAE